MLFAPFCGELAEGEADLEAGVAGFGFETDVAAVFADDAGDCVQAEARAFAHGFGGEEWFEDS